MAKTPELEHPSEANAKAAGQTFRLLFLDNAENNEQLKLACSDEGYTVVSALTMKDAWAFLDGKDHVDVIVCAAHLKEESVFDFLKAVRAHPIHGDTMFLVLSLEPGASGARMDRSTARSAMALGANGYVIMPTFDARALLDQIRPLLPSVPMLQQSATVAEKEQAE